MDIKICGPGCAKCREAEKIIRVVVAEAGIEARIDKITDFKEIARLGVFSTPAVVIDGQIKCIGKVPTKKEITGWLK